MADVRICPELRRLLDLFSDANREYTSRTRALADAAISYETEFFQRCWEECRRAREKCAAARSRLKAHALEHGCITDFPD